MRCCWLIAGIILFAAARAAAAEPVEPVAPPPAAKPPAAEKAPPIDDLYEVGSDLFDQLAPEEIKAQYEFPAREEWAGFVARLQNALNDNRLEELASYEAQTRTVLAAFQALPGYEEYVDWLKERLDYIEAAQLATKSPAFPPPSAANLAIPHYALWLKRLQARPVPARAAELLPMVQEVFVAAGLPPELAWLAEVESTFNPDARSPVGACGLYQLMAATARSLGLSVILPDERTDPEKNARAAAQYLRQLYGRFDDWPLAIAAYNAGPGRIGRLLAGRPVKTFAGIATALPSETRMYVPKVLATLAVRAGTSPENLAAPK